MGLRVGLRSVGVIGTDATFSIYNCIVAISGPLAYGRVGDKNMVVKLT